MHVYSANPPQNGLVQNGPRYRWFSISVTQKWQNFYSRFIVLPLLTPGRCFIKIHWKTCLYNGKFWYDQLCCVCQQLIMPASKWQSLFICLYSLYISGPFVSVIMAEQCGYRIPALLGGFLAALGLFLASFADSIIMLLISIGLITGT